MLLELVPFDIDAFLTAYPPPPPEAKAPGRGKAKGRPAPPRPVDAGAQAPINPENRDAALRGFVDVALADEAAKVRSAPQGEGNNAINRAAMKLGELGGAGVLDRDEAERAITVAAQERSPDRPLEEIAASFNSGWNHGLRTPRDLSNVGMLTAPAPVRVEDLIVLGADGAAIPPDSPLGGQPVQNVQVTPGLEKNPHRLARAYLAEEMAHPEGSRLKYWQDCYWEYTGTHYREVPEYELRARITSWLDRHLLAVWGGALEEWSGHREGPQPQLIEVTTALVTNVIQAIDGMILLPLSRVANAPAWLDGDASWPPHEVLPAFNSLIHLPSLVDHVSCSRAHTPNFFARHSFGYHFSREAPAPELWLDLLHNKWWPGDDKSVFLLQEWIGYLLTPDTSHQKMLYLIGPSRSGKGTIARVIKSLIGEYNCDWPTLSKLEDKFSLLGMMGKLVAIFADAKVGARSDTNQIVERLLSITGEDSQTIDRKHRDAFTAKISARLMIIANDPPRLRDPANALTSRILTLKMSNSFRGSEDQTLTARLMREMPGILLWAIDGWERLREQGRFTVPDSSLEMETEIRNLTSPIVPFLEDECRIGPDYSCPVEDLYNRWKQWCSQHGRDHVGDLDQFGRSLKSILPKVEKRRRRDGSAAGRSYYYFGVRPLAPHESPDVPEVVIIPEADPADLPFD